LRRTLGPHHLPERPSCSRVRLYATDYADRRPEVVKKYSGVQQEAQVQARYVEQLVPEPAKGRPETGQENKSAASPDRTPAPRETPRHDRTLHPPEMGSLWTLENRFRVWLEVELPCAKALVRTRVIPASDMEHIRVTADFDVDRILEIEEVTRH
jgi:hypothetical protein